MLDSSGLHRPSRWPLLLTAVGCCVAYYVFAGGFGFDRQASSFISFAPFLIFAIGASVLPIVLNFVQTGSDELVIRNFFVTRRIPTADIVSLGVRHANKNGQYLVVNYRAADKNVAYKFWNYYGQEDVLGLTEEIRTYNPRVVLDKDLTYFVEKVNEARVQGKPLAFVGYSKPVLSIEDIRKFWWMPIVAFALAWMAVKYGAFDFQY